MYRSGRIIPLPAFEKIENPQFRIFPTGSALFQQGRYFDQTSFMLIHKEIWPESCRQISLYPIVYIKVEFGFLQSRLLII